jgi:hypothetical protein
MFYLLHRITGMIKTVCQTRLVSVVIIVKAPNPNFSAALIVREVVRIYD